VQFGAKLAKRDRHGRTRLAEFGLPLSRHARDEDIAVRYGGEEFALVMPGASIEIATKAGRSSARCREAHACAFERKGVGPRHLVGRRGRLSGAWQLWHDGDREADAALYRAKWKRAITWNLRASQAPTTCVA
jgi:diguanylate cyclase (GGDEF)-like protein